MQLLLAGILIGLPVLDIISLIEVGGRIGLWPTLGLVVASFFVGSWLMRSQGFAILQQAQATLQDGRFPAREVFDGTCVMIGGLLLLFPGFASDVIGIALLIPFIRTQIRRLIGAQVHRSGRFVIWTVGPDGSPRSPLDPDARGGPVIDGEYQPVEDDDTDNRTASAAPATNGSGTPSETASSPWVCRSSTAVVRLDDP